ncbi:chorismate mutase [Streptomyces europaeiscabiei]|uniref:chorismate mutase n=1 Tax=Streptomyces europaeiscabiei TaxID=146819 RepID=A0ABU4NBG8_9ACTN|nr:chorismate mutase [Streptomyces europaeiscabiei]MDX2771284.1 chorismate mutase [Streptomyces europaeiscabiei]MDX3541357.1 chorismate mutase [Streptomyces europaeiscabiei]MDX3551698.1 chorismate mutase [Streptomyces europaeiscabiei]MDX3699937.1 chorismate mutase [Streptomyces europaeiscabiei]MDX3711063.1 chorismate mutase [Streptomyces europaeiscabiei]
MRPHRLRSFLISVPVSVCLSSALALSGAVPAVAVSSSTSTPPRTAAGPRSLTVLTDLFADRLLVADKVAAAKYGTATPIDDPVREKAILDDVAGRAVGLGLDPDAVTAVFRDQIEANKLVQRGLYARWDAHPQERPTERPDLVKDVRPVLDRITTQLLTALQETESRRAGASCEPWLRVAAARSAFAHRLDLLHGEGLARALPSVCGTRQP